MWTAWSISPENDVVVETKPKIKSENVRYTQMQEMVGFKRGLHKIKPRIYQGLLFVVERQK